eukprot:IDg18544t1
MNADMNTFMRKREEAHAKAAQSSSDEINSLFNLTGSHNNAVTLGAVGIMKALETLLRDE